jgi:hypothetical protein
VELILHNSSQPPKSQTVRKGRLAGKQKANIVGSSDGTKVRFYALRRCQQLPPFLAGSRPLDGIKLWMDNAWGNAFCHSRQLFAYQI